MEFFHEPATFVCYIKSLVRDLKDFLEGLSLSMNLPHFYVY
jgi:hypothetical protein